MLQSLDELRRIPGMEPLLSYPGWEELLTLESSGQLDLMEVPEEVLRLIPGFTENRVQRWLQIRSGPDQLLHTEDDPKYTDVTKVLKSLGMDEDKIKQLVQTDGLVSVGDQIVRVRSEGYSGKVIRQVQVVVRKVSGTPKIISWIE
jgi:hypothetical protein